MVVRRSRTVSAPVDEVWRIVRDPYHLPRWWPRTQRVEGVSSSGWTSVLLTDKGRTEGGIEMVQRPKGWARVGGMMLRRAARKQCDEALAGLAGLVEGA